MVSEEDVRKSLLEVIDPEIFIDVITLELIYDVKVEENKVKILMTFTTPLCPYGPQLKADVKAKILELEDIDEVEVEVTFNPRWEPSEELRALFGI